MFQQLLTQEVESDWYVQFSYHKKNDRYEVKMTRYIINGDKSETQVKYGQGSNVERALLDAQRKQTGDFNADKLEK